MRFRDSDYVHWSSCTSIVWHEDAVFRFSCSPISSRVGNNDLLHPTFTLVQKEKTAGIGLLMSLAVGTCYPTPRGRPTNTQYYFLPCRKSPGVRNHHRQQVSHFLQRVYDPRPESLARSNAKSPASRFPLPASRFPLPALLSPSRPE